jgi:flagellar assembly factor FliW
MESLILSSSRFGEVELPPGAVLDFPAGLIGIGGRRFALVARRESSAFLWLHSLEDPDLALPVTNPWHFFPDFALEISDEDAARIGLDGTEDTAVYVTVRAGESADDFWANLAAPIIVWEGRGFQVLNTAPEAAVRVPLFGGPTAQAA